MPAVFIHGVTVRKDRFASLLTEVTEGVWRLRAGMNVGGVYWGDLGSQLRFKGASIPGFVAGTKAMKNVDEERVELVLLLLENPFYELELLAPRDAPQSDLQSKLPPPPRDKQLDLVRPTLAEDVARRFPDVVGRIGGDDGEVALHTLINKSFAAAKGTQHTLTPTQLIGPLARSLTAGLYSLTVDPTDLDPDFRWSEVESGTEKLLEERFKGAKGPLKAALAHTTTFALQRGGRRKLMAGLSIFVGDVVKYLSHRDEILGRVEKELDEICTGPDELWIIGHSLGGVIAYEYCELGRRDVARLVTVGSQVGLLAEMGAIGGDGPGKLPMPPRTERWLNIFDESDMLSFLAEPIFDGVEDMAVRTGAPFPAAHSEYWAAQAVYEAIARNA